MKILAWNTGWNWGETVVRAQTAAVDALGADVAFFSEWSPLRERLTCAGTLRASSGYLRGGHLADIGLREQCQEHLSDREGDGRDWIDAPWGILGASRTPITKTVLMPPLHAPGSWLEVDHEGSGLTLVGLRMPAWERPDLHHRRELWLWMTEQFERLASTPAIVMGDFNTELSYSSPAKAQAYGGDLLRSLTREHGWRDPYDATRTAKQPTFWHRTSRRIDYALVSPGFDGTIDAVDAPTVVGDLVTSGPSRTESGERRGRLADHAPLVIEVSPTRVSECSRPSGAGTTARREYSTLFARSNGDRGSEEGARETSPLRPEASVPADRAVSKRQQRDERPSLLDVFPFVVNHLDASGRIEEIDAAATEAGIVLDSSAGVQLVARLQQILIDENQPIGVAVPCLLGSTFDALSGVHLEERSRNCLRQAGLRTWGDVAEKQPSQLGSIRNAGVITINDILKAALRQAARDCARLVPNTGVPESFSRIGKDSRGTCLPDQSPIPATLLTAPAVNGVLAPLALLLEWGSDQADPQRLVALIGSSPDTTDLPPDVADARTRLDDGIRVLAGHVGSQGADLDGLVRQLFDSFGPGERLAFEQRVLNDDPPTLDKIGEELGVTGSRVCQLQSKAEEKCAMALGDDAFALLLWRACEVRSSLGAIAPIDHPLTASVLETAMRGSNAQGPRLRALLLHLAGPYRMQDRWLVNEAGERPQHEELEKLVTPDVPLPWEIASEWMTERGIREEFHGPWIEGAKRLRRADQLLVSWPQNLGGCCVSLLTVLARPASADELTDLLPSDHSVLTVRRALSADERTVRVSRTDWALKTWGLEEYSGMAQEIGRRIDEQGGRVRIIELAEEIAEQFNVKATSVRLQAAAPAFVIEDQWVRRRESGEPYLNKASMATARGAFRTSEGVSMLLEIDKGVLRGGGRPLAPGVARVFGVGPGGRRAFTYAGGSVVVTWPTTAPTGPTMGSVRELANTLESCCGDRIRLDFRMADGVVTANRIDSHDLESLDWAPALEQLTGLSDLGDRCLPTLATAIEVSPGEVHAALRQRGDHDVAALLPGSIVSPVTVSAKTPTWTT